MRWNLFLVAAGLVLLVVGIYCWSESFLATGLMAVGLVVAGVGLMRDDGTAN